MDQGTIKDFDEQARTGTLLDRRSRGGPDRRRVPGSVGHPDAPDRSAREVRDGRARRNDGRSLPPDRDLGLTAAALSRSCCRGPGAGTPCPGVNDGRSRSGTTIGTSGCRGLRAIRRFRCFRSNVPKSARVTRSPSTTVSRTVLIAASITRPTSALLKPVFFETSVTKPPLFMDAPSRVVAVASERTERRP